MEITQFRDYLGSPTRSSEETSNDHIISNILYRGMVKSMIVYNKELTSAEKMGQLIEKYILEGSEFEINIAYRLFSSIFF